MTSTKRQPLTVGDTIVVVALLVFIGAWVGGWLWGLSGTPSKDFNDGWADAVLVATIAIPAIWAGNLIGYIVGGGDR